MDDHRQQSWDRTTLLHWRQLLACYEPSELGLELYPALFFWDVPGPAYRPECSHWWIHDPDLMPVRIMGPDDCAAKGYAGAAGLAYQTITVNPRMYCAWLLRQCEGTREGLFESRVLHAQSLSQALDEVPSARIIVNCTGLGAGKLADDEACFPTLGQTVLVKGKAHSVVTRRNEEDEQPWEALVIPQPGEELTVLGGCKLKGDWCTEPSDRMTATILERCKPLAPELLNEDGAFEVQEVRVGLRPSREGGPRISVESLEDGRYVVHNYGHHSSGFEGSVGLAEEATNLIQGLLKSEEA